MKNTMRWQLTSSVLHGFMGAVQTAYGYTKDLNESLNSIQIVTEKNSEAMDDFAEKANKAAKALSTTTVDYTDASLIYYQQGLSDEEVEGRTNTTIKLANVAAESAENASEQLTAIWNNFYDGSKSLEYYADVMTALGASTASSTQEISAGLQKFAAIANTVGLSYEYAASALATITATTRESADVVGTALRTLFARIQGLNQDQTQDDGTTLNKYSKALAEVGISIKDTDGQLKGMNAILDEMGAKWQSLTQAQKMALAQTVAGVRQYSQLIALMENYDFFQENLTTAMKSEGTLNRQAEVYAESWEAARDRTRAAAEDIYDSLINDDFYIDVDNIITPILSGVADVVDALGGMQGVLAVLATLMNKVYGDKIVESLRNFATNIGIIRGIEGQRSRELQRQAGELVENLTISYAANDAEAMKLNMLKEEIVLQGTINEHIDNLDESQKQYLYTEQQKIDMMRQEANQLTDNMNKLMQTSNISRETIYFSVGFTEGWQQKLIDEIKKFNGQNQNNRITFLPAIDTSVDEVFNRIISEMEKLAQQSAKVSALSNGFNQLTASTDASEKELRELLNTLGYTREATLPAEELENKIREIGNSTTFTNQKMTELGRLLALMGADTTSVTQYIAELRELANETNNAESVTRRLTEIAHKLSEQVRSETIPSIKDWASIMVQVGSTIAQLSMVINSLNNISQIITDKDIDNSEKFLRILTSIGMIVPFIASTFGKLSKMLAAHQIKLLGATAATQALAAAKTKAAVAAGIFTAALTTLVIGVISVVNYLKEQREATLEAAQASIDAANAAKEEADANNKLIKSTKEALSVYVNTGENKEELDEATRSLAEAYNLEGSALAKLSGRYEDYEEVIRKAIAQQKQDLKDTLDDYETALNAIPNKMLITAREGTGHIYGAGSYEGEFGGYSFGGTNEVDAANYYKTNVSEKFRANASTSVISGFGRTGVGFSLDANDPQNLVQFYDEVSKALEEMDANMSAVDRGNSGIYNGLVEWRDKMQEVVEEYRSLQDNANKIRIQLGEVGNSITDDQITNFDTFKTWVLQTTTALETMRYKGEDIDKILNDLVKTSLNPSIEGFKNLYDAISDAKAQVSDPEFRNKIEDYFSNDIYDKAALATIAWGTVTKDNWEQAYNSAKKYQEAVNDVQQATTQLSGIKTAEKIIGKSKGEVDIDTLKEISSSVDWGNEEQNIIEFSEFLQMNSREQIEFLQQLTTKSYQQMADGLNNSIEASQEKIKQQQNFLDGINNQTIQSAEANVNAWRTIYNAYKEYHSLSDTGQKDNFDLTKYSEAIAITGINWDDFKEQTEEEVSGAIEDATKDSQVTLDTVANAENIIEDCQNQIDEDNKSLIITAKVAFENQLENIEDSVDGIVSIFDAISKGVESTTNEAGEKVWGFSREAAEAIESVYPGFLANAQLLRDGTFALSEEMYQAFFDSANGQLSADTQSKAGMLQNIITILEQRKASAESSLAIAQQLANGEMTLEEAKNKYGEQLMTDFVNGRENANGEMLDDEVKALSKSDTNWSTLWDNVSNYSAQGAENMATNVANSTGLVLENLEKIRDAAYKACQQVAAVGTTNTLYSTSIDTNANFGTADWKVNIDTSNVDTFFDTLGDTTNVTAEDLFIYGTADEVKARQVGKELEVYYQNLIDSYDAQIGSAKIAQSKLLEGIDNSYDKLTKSQSGSSKDNTGKVYDAEDKKELDEVIERYHEITREIERQSDVLDDIGNEVNRAYGADKLKAYKKELQALEKQQINYQEKLNQANEWLKIDASKVQDRFGNAAILDTTTGEVVNYTDLMTAKWQEYSAFVDAYNKERAEWSLWTKEQQEANAELIAQREAEFKQKEQNLTLDLQVLEQYEKTLDVQREQVDLIQETNRAIADDKLSQIEYTLEIVIDVKSMQDALRDFDQQVQEIFNDALTHGISVADIARDQAQAEADMLPDYQNQFARLKEAYESADNEMDRQRIIEDIKNLQSNVLDSASAIVEWVDSIEDIIPDAVDAARERYELFTNQLEHNTTVLDTIKELYTLQGVTYKTMDGFNRLQSVSQERLDAQLAQSELQRAWYDEARTRLQQAQADLDSLGGDETDLRYDTYKQARDAYLAEFNEAQEAYLSLAKDAMQTAQDMYLEQIEQAVYEFGQAVSGGIGLDLLQDKYDHYIEQDERYFDKVNEAYQTTAWFNKLQQDIDKATNSATKERLQALQDEINIRRENNKLSQYDLDILNAKYEVLQAQMALEDAQNAKNKLQLVRDSQGNWNYQYTADQDQIAGAEQDLIDAQNDWYNIAKQQVTDVTGEIVSTWQECQEKIKQIYSDMTLTDQERSDRAAEIYQYYTDKIKYLEEEKQVAIADMTQAGNESLLTDAILMGDELTDLTGLTAEEVKALVEENGNSVINLLTSDNETIKNIVASNTDLIDLFDNVYAQDLDNMTNNTNQFEIALQETMAKAEEDFLKYNDTVSQVADETGTSLEDLDDDTQELSYSTDELRDSGLDAADALWSMIDVAADAANEYLNLADSIWEAVEALRALAAENASYVGSKADITEDEPINDYSYYFATQRAQGKDIFSDEYADEWQKRAEKRPVNAGSLDNDQLQTLFHKADRGDAGANQVIAGVFNGEGTFQDLVKKYAVQLATGGYTGEFSDAKLAFLHEKELVLNKEDTENILKAVDIVRNLDNIFASIEKMLDGNGIAAIALMASKLSGTAVSPVEGSIEQTIHIDSVEFPNVTSSDEIKEAFASIADDAVQWARRRKE